MFFTTFFDYDGSHVNHNASPGAGAVHQFQPVHGYFLRRELLTWHVDEWANIQPGSIYNALRSLKKDGYVEETGTESEGNRPERTTYSITPEGEVEFLRLLRGALWTVGTFDIGPVMALTSFMYALSREEVLAALDHRVREIDAKIASNQYSIEDVHRSTSTPAYVREIFELSISRLRGEQQWVRGLSERMRAGEYTFAGETKKPKVAQPKETPAQGRLPGACRRNFLRNHWLGRSGSQKCRSLPLLEAATTGISAVQRTRNGPVDTHPG